MKKGVLSFNAVIAAAALSGTTTTAQPACSCSPRALTLQINLSGTCPASITNVDPLNDICYVSKDAGTTPGVTPDLESPGNQNFDKIPTKIDSISYYELNEKLEVINQDSISVTKGDSSVDEVSFTSVTAELNPNLPLSEQAQYVVAAVVLVIAGYNTEGLPIKNTVSWKYDLDMCNQAPMAIGDTLGWMNVVGLTPASTVFCPDAPLPIEPTATPSFASTFHKLETTTEATPAASMSMSLGMLGTKSSKKHANAKSAKIFKTKSSKLGSYLYAFGSDTLAHHSKASTKSAKVVVAHKSPKAKASGSYETKPVFSVNSKQSTKSSKTKSSKAISDTKAHKPLMSMKPHEGSMVSGWGSGSGRW